jgi:hypothetical protein
LVLLKGKDLPSYVVGFFVLVFASGLNYAFMHPLSARDHGRAYIDTGIEPDTFYIAQGSGMPTPPPEPVFEGKIVTLSYALTPVTTSEYTELVSATTFSVYHIQFCDTSGSIVEIAQGAVGHEVNIFSGPASSCTLLALNVPQYTRLSIRAVDVAAVSGFNTVSFIP